MAYSSSVRVYFEIGHEASLRNKRTIEGFTHDWEVFVRGVDNAEIHHFIDKVVFHLHDTFPKPKRTIKDPPYCLKESGYAGFNLPIDIYLKKKDEHRKIRFFYDLTLQPSGPRITKVIKEKADFVNPAEDFRRKLIKGGGVSIGNDSTTSLEKSSSVNSSHGDDLKSSPHPGKPKLSNSETPKKHKPKETSKPDDSRGSNTFAALFGTPTKTSKHSPTLKTSSKSSSSSEIKSSHDKQAKESSKISKHSPHKDKESSVNKHKEKERDKEKDLDRSNKDKDRNKEKEHKEKDKSKDKLSKKSISPLPSKEARKEESSKRSEDNNKERNSSKNENLKEKKHKEKKHKEEREKKDTLKEHDKKEPEREKPNDKIEKKSDTTSKDKDIKESRIKSSEKEDKKSKSNDKEKDKSHDSEKSKHKHKRKEKHRKEDEKDRHKKKLKGSSPEPLPPPSKKKSPSPPPPPPPPQPVVAQSKSTNPLNTLIQELSDKESDSDFTAEEDSRSDPPPPEPPKPPKNESKKTEVRDEREKNKKKDKKNKDEEKEKKRKRKTKEKDEPKEKLAKPAEIKEEVIEKSPEQSDETDSPEGNIFTDDYIIELRELQHKIMTLQDDSELQRIVKVISETGQFEVNNTTFDFDLCALDRSTVRRLQDMFIAASS